MDSKFLVLFAKNYFKFDNEKVCYKISILFVSSAKKNIYWRWSLILSAMKKLWEKFLWLWWKFWKYEKNSACSHNILQKIFLVQEKLKVATENLNLATEKLRNEISATPKQKYQLREVTNILFQHYIALKKDLEKLVAQK